jgi:transcriptional regulator with XRE-family HTH domain
MSTYNLAVPVYQNLGKPVRMNPGKIIGENVRRIREAIPMSANGLAKAINVRVNTVQKIEDGTTQKSKHLPDIARVLGVPLAAIDPSQGPNSDADANVRTEIIPARDMSGVPSDLPIYASVECGDGNVWVSPEPVQTIKRPDPLATVKKGYGVIVVGESMVPAVRPGATVLVNPHLPPKVEDLCLFMSGPEDREFKATLKEYRGQTADLWKVRRYGDDPKDFTLKKRDWPRCHVVVVQYRSS